MRTHFMRVGVALLGLAMAASAQALTTVTGQITSTLILTSSCKVNVGSTTSGLSFGTLDFGTTDSLFTTANGQVLPLSILCSSGTSPVVKVRAGAHDGGSSGGTRALSDGAGNFVPYDFYTDAGHASILPIDGTVALGLSTGVAQTVNLYGKATGKAGLPAGTYTDTVAVELSF
jgi:spore coat protein U-like protein